MILARLLLCILISLVLATELNDSWIFTVNGPTVKMNSDGTFRIPNISAPDRFGLGGQGTRPDFVSDDFARAIGVSTKDGKTRYVFSEFFQTRQAQTYIITNLTFTDIPPRQPESLTIIPDARVMTMLGQINRLRVVARYAGGTTSDVTPKAAWTCYRVSNPNIAKKSSSAESRAGVRMPGILRGS